MKDADCWAGLFLLVFSFLGTAVGKQIVHLKTQGMSAAFFPNMLFIVLAVCGFVLIFQGWKREEKSPLPKFIWRKLLPWFVLLAAYSITFEYIGFIIATVLFMIAGMFLLGERRWMLLGLVPVGSSFGIYYLFSKVFMIAMP